MAKFDGSKGEINMQEKKFELTQTDLNAIRHNDFNYINQKGARLYTDEDYAKAIEYYRIASAMGDVNAITNLGYCYLYGRSIEANLSLALAYFEIAAAKRNVDACYKLGDIYGSDKWGVKDKEMSIYYYRMAASFLIRDEWDIPNSIFYSTFLQDYPSLCFALGRELMPGGEMATNIDEAYQFLKHAEIGYRRELANGASFYELTYTSVQECLQNEVFDDIRDKYDALFDGEDEEEVVN